MIEILGAAATIAVGILAAIQWHISKRSDERYRQAERKAKERERDTEMTRWGSEVIDVMAEIETACAPLSKESKYSAAEIEALSHRASALVDKGRLYFPNVPSRSGAPEDEGVRVRILDQVLRACYIARHLIAHGHGDGLALRQHMWQARRDFVRLLQKEMGNALQQVGEESRGDHVPINPMEWPKPVKALRLPVRDQQVARSPD